MIGWSICQLQDYLESRGALVEKTVQYQLGPFYNPTR